MGVLVASRPALAGALAFANTLARGEILVALREPQRQLVTLLKRRSVALEEQSELDEFVEKVGTSEWGMW